MKPVMVVVGTRPEIVKMAPVIKALKEATAPLIRKPVLVIRLSTERPEAVEAGFAKVVGTEKHQILTAIKTALESKKQLPEKSPFGDGNAAEKIDEIIGEELPIEVTA